MWLEFFSTVTDHNEFDATGSAVNVVEVKPHVVKHLLCTRGTSLPGDVGDLIRGIIL